MKTFAATAATALALLGLGAAAAPAKPNQPELGNFVTLKLGPTQGLFRGAVHSQVRECVANRKVRIVEVEGDSTTRIARGLASNDGHYAIQTGEVSGTWFAKVKRIDIGGGYHCAAAKTKVKSAG